MTCSGQMILSLYWIHICCKEQYKVNNSISIIKSFMSRKEVISSEKYTVAFSQGLSRCHSHVRMSYYVCRWYQSITVFHFHCRLSHTGFVSKQTWPRWVIVLWTTSTRCMVHSLAYTIIPTYGIWLEPFELQIEKDRCKREFESLKTCFQSSLKKSLR